MLLPVRFNIPQKADTTPITVQQTSQNVQTVEIAQTQNADNIIPAMQTEPKTDILQTGTSFVKRIIDNRLNILAYLWLTGLILLMLINLIGYIRLIIKMRKNSVVVSCPELTNFTDKRVTVRVWENTSSPFMTGIFRPTLVLPDRELTEEQLNNILRHEMTHFKRHDILYKWLVSFVKCLHWFNPVIWYVTKQINTECEISCDMAVTLEMSKSQEMSYIDTVLSLLPKGKTKQIPLTTQMANSKMVLKRRFEMIRNKRRTSKFVSALSAVIAVVMLGTTVFASGVLSDLSADDYIFEIKNYGQKIELTNKPFMTDDNMSYIPLRELFKKIGVLNSNESSIEWDNGKIIVNITDDTIGTRTFGIEVGNGNMQLNPNRENNTNNFIDMGYVPILQNNTTYVPFPYIDYMLCQFGDRYKVICDVWDKRKGNNINRESDYRDVQGLTFNRDVYNQYEKYNDAIDVIRSFFRAFSADDINAMANYCTEKCRNTFFGDGYVFGMTRAELTNVTIVDDSRFDFVAFVGVNMTPHERSVFDKSQTETSFYLILEKQPDGRYLIDEFATGL